VPEKTKASVQVDEEGLHILVETEVIDFSELRKKEIIMYYIVEIHSTESSEIGIMAEELDGVQHPLKFDSFSKARVKASLLEEQFGKNSHWYTKIISVEDEVE